MPINMLIHSISSADNEVLKNCLACCRLDDTVIFITEGRAAIHSPIIEQFIELGCNVLQVQLEDETSADVQLQASRIRSITLKEYVNLTVNATKVLSWF